MRHRISSGRFTKFELNHPSGDNKFEHFVEAQKNFLYSYGPAILITCRNKSVLEVKPVKNLDPSLQHHFLNLNAENRYFYRCVNQLKPLKYHYILESKLIFAE